MFYEHQENNSEECKLIVNEVAESKVDRRNQALTFAGSRAGSVSCGFGTRTPIRSRRPKVLAIEAAKMSSSFAEGDESVSSYLKFLSRAAHELSELSAGPLLTSIRF